MKLLPCSSDSCRLSAKRGAATDHAGMAYYAERFPGRAGDSFRYVCGACGQLREITAPQFNSIPEATVPEMEAAGILYHLTKDLRVAAGVLPAQAVDLYIWGFRHPSELPPPPEGLDSGETAALPSPE